MVISPYAKSGFIDHQTLSFDAYNKFIEDDFLGGQRLDPKTDGRPDPRPDVRENDPLLGDLTADFDFDRGPRPPVLLPVHPKTTLVGRPPFQPTNVSARKSNGRITVTWQTPQSDGGRPITGYQVIPYVNDQEQPSRSFAAGTNRGVMNGLPTGRRYTFKVAAINRVGVGVLSTATRVIAN
jgi:hypothetical protein